MDTQTTVGGIEAAPRWLTGALPLLAFLFPMVVATTDGGGSYVYVALLLLGLFFGRDWRELATWEKKVLLGFTAGFFAMLLSTLNTADMHEAGKWIERYLRLALLAPMYLMFRRFGLRLGREFALGAALATLLMAAQAWYQVGWEHEAVASGFYHKIVFGDLAVLWGTVAVVFGLVVLQGWQRFVLISVSAGASLYASVLSQTRGAWLFVLVFMFALTIIYGRRVLANRRALTLVVVAALAAGSVLVWQWPRLSGGIESGVRDLQTFMKDPSAGTSWGIRLNLWRNTLIIAEQHPLLGTGLGDFHGDMRRMAADGTSWSPAVAEYGHAHSIYFDTLANGGIIALLATVIGYLLLPFLMFYRALRTAVTPSARFYALGGLMTVLAFATFGLSEALWVRNPFVNTYVVSILVFMSGLAGVAADRCAE